MSAASCDSSAGAPAAAGGYHDAAGLLRPVALVLGAGAQGLASALRLWEQGWDVVVCARDWLSDTTSSGAGAIWEYPPFLVQPQDKARRWTLSSLACFAACREAAGSYRSGVRLLRSHYLFRSEARAREAYGPFEAWRDAVPGFREGPPPGGGLARGGLFTYCFSYVAPIVNMRQYLSWLTEAIGALPGVSLRHAVLSDAAGAASLASKVGAEVVVNCLGLGARRVFGDTALHGVRGDLVYVLAPGAEERYGFAHASDEDDPEGQLTYAVPQGDGIVGLAGTAERLSDEQLEVGYRPRQEAAAVRAELAQQIVARSLAAIPGAALAPQAGEAAKPLVVGHWTGARPQRDGGVRLEAEDLKLPSTGGGCGCGGGNVSLRLVHNYGHGGSGVITSWGCAADVAALAASSKARLSPRRLPAALAPLAADGVDALGQAAVARAVAELGLDESRSQLQPDSFRARL